MSPATKATRRDWIALAVIALPCMLYSMDLTVLNLAVPAITAELQPSAAQLLWIIDIYGFMVAGFLIPMGNLGDRIGRRRLLLAGAAAFGAASLLAALARSTETLIAARALLGIAGATLAPSTLSLIRTLFQDPRERTFAIGVWVTSYSVGAAIGPVLGGVVLQFFHWGAVFLIGVPVMLLLLVLGPALLPETRDREAGRIDAPSVALSLAAALSVIYALKRIAEDGLAPLPIAFALGGVALGVVFVRRQRRLADPLIDLALFRIPAFRTALASLALACMALFGIFVFIAQYLQLVLGLSALAAGLWTVPWALAFVVGSLLTPRLAQYTAPVPLMARGLLLAALGFALLGAAGVGSSPAVILVGAMLLSLGLAPTFTLATDLVVGAVPPQRAGAAAALSETSSEFGGALGIALFGALGAFLYRQGMPDVAPTGVAPAALEAARRTLGATLELGASVGASALQDTARQAFVDGLHATAYAGAVLMLASAWLVARSRRMPGAQGRPVR